MVAHEALHSFNARDRGYPGSTGVDPVFDGFQLREVAAEPRVIPDDYVARVAQPFQVAEQATEFRLLIQPSRTPDIDVLTNNCQSLPSCDAPATSCP